MNANEFWTSQRNARKREIAKRHIEFALNQGKTVVQITPESSVKMKRKGRLTLMENWKPVSGQIVGYSANEILTDDI